MMTTDEYSFWISCLYYKEPAAARRLLSCFNDPESAFAATEKEILEKTGLDDALTGIIIRSRDERSVRNNLEKIRKNGIQFISQSDEKYPSCLNELKDRPVCLYIKGSLPDPEIACVGMVGARACTGYGREYASRYASELANAGIQVISGMAVGIDSISARSVLDSGGRTYAILGSGIDVIYPRENMELYYEIITSGGGIISEYPPGTPPKPWNFPHRNRLIAAFSEILLVMEAGKRSGTLSTAMHALDLGKDVWALPGRVGDRLSEGCNELISDGAGILTDINRVISIIGNERSLNKKTVPESTSHQNSVFDFIGYEPVETENIISLSGLPADLVIQMLTELEIEGQIIRLSGDCFIRRC